MKSKLFSLSALGLVTLAFSTSSFATCVKEIFESQKFSGQFNNDRESDEIILLKGILSQN